MTAVPILPDPTRSYPALRCPGWGLADRPSGPTGLFRKGDLAQVRRPARPQRCDQLVDSLGRPAVLLPTVPTVPTVLSEGDQLV